jgi:hypothetical protein
VDRRERLSEGRGGRLGEPCTQTILTSIAQRTAGYRFLCARGRNATSLEIHEPFSGECERLERGPVDTRAKEIQTDPALAIPLVVT